MALHSKRRQFRQRYRNEREIFCLHFEALYYFCSLRVPYFSFPQIFNTFHCTNYFTPFWIQCVCEIEMSNSVGRCYRMYRKMLNIFLPSRWGRMELWWMRCKILKFGGSHTTGQKKKDVGEEKPKTVLFAATSRHIYFGVCLRYRYIILDSDHPDL